MKKVQTHARYGLITGFVMIVVGLLMYLTNLSFQSWSQWVSYAFFLGGLILNATAYSKANEANVTFGNVFGSCFKATLIITLMMTVWVIIFIMIFPEMKEKAMEMSTQRMEQRGMSEEQIEQGMKMAKMFTSTPMMAAITAVGSIFMGSIFSLIASAVAKKKPQPQHIQQ